MKRKLVISYVLLILFIVFVITFIYYKKSYEVHATRVEKDLVNQGYLLVELLKKQNDDTHLQNTLNFYSKKINARITLIDKDGVVLADTEKDYRVMDKHKYRPEVKSALEGKIGTSIRYSKTMNMDYLYTALPLNTNLFNGVVRLSVPLKEIKQLGSQFIKLSIVGTIVGVLIAILIYYVFIKYVTKPLDELTEAAVAISKDDYNKKMSRYKDKQFCELAEAFNHMTLKLKENVSQLKNRNIELESILSSMINGIIAVDKDYKIILNNKVCFDLLYIKNKNIIGESIYDVIRNKSIYDIIENTFKNRKYNVVEVEYNIDDGKKLKLHANPIISNTENQMIGVLLIIQDITQIAKLENVRRDFVSNVTHELKTPLTSIRGFVDTLKNGAINEPKVAKRFLDIIAIEAERLYRLIQDILVLSEIENKKQDVNVELQDIKIIVKEIEEILIQKAQKKGIDLIIDVNDKVPKLNCNKDKIKQLLINLLDNAIKYTEKGYVKFTANKEKDSIIFIVEDTGIGIEKVYIPRLFERFYRVDKGRSRKMGGTGLGLSIVKHIVELYNGSIEVDTELNKGTKFVVKIPY